MALPVITVHWRDGNGKRGETRFFVGEVTSLPQAIARAEPIITAMAGASSATVTHYEYTRSVPFAGAIPAAAESDTRSLLLLFYGNSTGAATLIVPSPRPLPVDLVGPYRNVRLDLDAPDLPALLSPMGSGLDSAVAPGGNAWPMPLRAGGLTRYGGE